MFFIWIFLAWELNQFKEKIRRSSSSKRAVALPTPSTAQTLLFPACVALPFAEKEELSKALGLRPANAAFLQILLMH